MGDRIDRATLLQFISEVLEGNAYCDNALYKYVLQGAKKTFLPQMWSRGRGGSGFSLENAQNVEVALHSGLWLPLIMNQTSAPTAGLI